MSTVEVRYFALLREQAGLSVESVETPAATLDELYRELAARHGFSLPVAQVRAAVDNAYAAPETPVRSGMSVAWIPPVAGG